jgi:hypothetical protein
MDVVEVEVIDIDGVAVVIRLAVDKIIPETRLAQARVDTKRRNDEAEACVRAVTAALVLRIE